MIYFDNAATSWPKPPEVFEAMNLFMREMGGNPGRSGHRMATGAEAMIGECRNAVSKFFGLGDPARCVFTLNCTDALNMAIKGVVKQGDHVITTALEHNSISRPLQQMADDGFITLTRVVPEFEKGAWAVDEIIRHVTPQTSLVALTHCANVTGVINPIEDFGAALRKANPKSLLLADAAQSAGVVPINMEAAQIDLLAFPGHKALFAPTGTGALLIGPRVDGESFICWREGGTGGDSTSPLQPSELPHRLEGGTPNTMGIAGMLAGVRFLNRQGDGKVLAHERAIVKKLIDAFDADKRFTIYGTKDLSRKVGALSITIQDRDNAEVASILDQAFEIAVRPGLHCAPYMHKHLGTFPTGTLRLAPGFFSTLEETDAVIKALQEIAAG
ncbi:MAG TPA: aminotransferase class V-fold PLP-dependent enzyme [Planctomycetota bacterium]|nr:aminotransferase class V-fold PLP-dependent enzyme [Planctomycetota bacterium]